MRGWVPVQDGHAPGMTAAFTFAGMTMSAKITAYRRELFLKFLAETGNQTLSAERAKVSLRKSGRCECPPDIHTSSFGRATCETFR